MVIAAVKLGLLGWRGRVHVKGCRAARSNAGLCWEVLEALECNVYPWRTSGGVSGQPASSLASSLTVQKSPLLCVMLAACRACALLHSMLAVAAGFYLLLYRDLGKCSGRAFCYDEQSWCELLAAC